MESLAKVLADITEFLVGGVLFLGSLLLLAHVLAPDGLGALVEREPPAAVGGMLTVVGLALVYAFGVMAEGMSRMLFEARLTWLTVQRLEPVAAGRQAEGPTGGGPIETSGEDRRDVVGAGNGQFASKSVEVEHGGKRGRGLADLYHERDRREAAKAMRELWRAEATSYSESLGNTIESQLKRLRIERTFFLSSLLCLLAVTIERNWPVAAAVAVLCVMTALLVDERFRRFLGAIVRAHGIVTEGRVAPDSGVSTGASA